VVGSAVSMDVEYSKKDTRRRPKFLRLDKGKTGYQDDESLQLITQIPMKSNYLCLSVF
jgi:hypothetical protein